jgi:hypothetical protein
MMRRAVLFALSLMTRKPINKRGSREFESWDSRHRTLQAEVATPTPIWDYHLTILVLILLTASGKCRFQ